MSAKHQFLKTLYEAFNARDIELAAYAIQDGESVRNIPYCRLGKGANPNKRSSSSVSMPMKKLFLALAVIGSVIGTSLTAMADDDHRNRDDDHRDHDDDHRNRDDDHRDHDDDHRDRDWNDEYWHHEHYGYWHGERGYWQYRHHKHQFIRVGPVTIEEGH